MSDVIKSSRSGTVAEITINRGPEGNMLTLEMLGELAASFRDAGASDAKVILLRTMGDDFCCGRDPKGGPLPSTALGIRTKLISPILNMYDAISGAPQPIVCAVQGAALGFGCALATACDVTIAADVACFRLPEMEKNLPPTLAISAMMKRVPRKALTWLVYSMQEIDAQAALRLGIVSHVVAAGQLQSEVNNFVATLSERSPEALVAVKDYFRTALEMEERGAADYAGNLLATVFSSAKS